MDKKEFGEIVDLVSKVIVVTPPDLQKKKKALREVTEEIQAERMQQVFLNGKFYDKDNITLEDVALAWKECCEYETQEKPKHYTEYFKKQIKHSKHPLEMKQLDNKLNAAYKEMGKRR